MCFICVNFFLPSLNVFRWLCTVHKLTPTVLGKFHGTQAEFVGC